MVVVVSMDVLIIRQEKVSDLVAKGIAMWKHGRNTRQHGILDTTNDKTTQARNSNPEDCAHPGVRTVSISIAPEVIQTMAKQGVGVLFCSTSIKFD